MISSFAIAECENKVTAHNENLSGDLLQITMSDLETSDTENLAKDLSAITISDSDTTDTQTHIMT